MDDKGSVTPALERFCAFLPRNLPPSDGARAKLGIADLKEENDAAEEAFV